MVPIHINLSKLKDDEIVGSVATRVKIQSMILASEHRLKTDFHLVLRHFAGEEFKGRNAWILYDTLTYAGETSQGLSQEELDALFVRTFGKEGKEMSVTFMDAMLEEERAKGEAKGEAKGKAEGKAEVIIRYLKKEFGSISPKVEESILGMTDNTALDSLLENVFDCSTIQEVENLLIQ